MTTQRHPAETEPASPWRLLRSVGLLGVLGIAVGFGLGQGALVRGAVDLFQIIAEAQYRNYVATSNLSSDGMSEYLVWLADEDDVQATLDRFVQFRTGWKVRESTLPGWVVLRVPQAELSAKTVIAEQPFARAVLKNRGIWLCH